MTRLSPLALTLLAALGPALPALGQETPGDAPMCGGAPAPWLTGTRAESDIGTADAPLDTQLTTAEDGGPWVAFTVTGDPQAIRLEAQSAGDPALRLETPDGDLVAENDDIPGALDSRIEAQLAPGDYCARLIAVGDPDLTARLRLSTPDMPPLLTEAAGTAPIAPCTAATAAASLADGPLAQALPLTVDAGGGVSYHRLTLDGRTGLTLRATSAELDPRMALFDAAGGLVAENDDADGLNARLDFPNPLAAGDYCLGVAPVGAGAGGISLSAEPLDRAAFLAAAWARGALAPPADGSVPMLALEFPRDDETVLLHDGGAQWMRFDLDRETMFVADAHGQSAGLDTKLALFGPDGMPLAENDDHGAGTDSRLGPILLAPGRYRMVLTDAVGDGTRGQVRPVGLVVARYLRDR